MPRPEQREFALSLQGNRKLPDYPWAQLSDEELLTWRVSDLKLSLEHSEVEPLVQRFYAELETKGVAFRPLCYLTNEWLTPDKVPLIGVPFCLAHPRLRQLEKAMMLEVEGSSETEFMKLLRHEAGHAFNFAYQFYRRTRWRELFGCFSEEYNVADYYARPYSKKYVVHLDDNYAQAHPDEDFAETFAVWLTPGLDWRAKYDGWGALKKLEYVDKLMTRAGPSVPPVKSGPRLWPANRTRATLDSYYKRKRAEFAEAYSGYYDPDLRRLFTETAPPQGIPADKYLARHRRTLTNMVAQWARVPKYSVDSLIRRLARRASDLALYLPSTEAEAMAPVGVYLTALACARRDDAHSA